MVHKLGNTFNLIKYVIVIVLKSLFKRFPASVVYQVTKAKQITSYFNLKQSFSRK